MANKILTTHVGSLPRTPELLEANLKRDEIGEDAFKEILTNSVNEVVKRQVDLGIDIVNEGEYGHVTSGAVDYGAWWNYSFTRLGGLTITDEDRWANEDKIRSTPGNIQLTSFQDRRDRERFREAYEDPDAGVLVGRAAVGNPKFTGPITYIGKEQVETDVKLLKDAIEAAGGDKGFVAALSPGSAARLKNEFYSSDEEVVYACADALAQEYRSSPMRASPCSSMLRILLNHGIRSTLSPLWMITRSGCKSALMHSTTPLRIFRGSSPACTSAGVPGTGRTRRISRSLTSSIRFLRLTPVATPSRAHPRVTPTSGVYGRITPCPKTRSFTRA